MSEERCEICRHCSFFTLGGEFDLVHAHMPCLLWYQVPEVEMCAHWRNAAPLPVERKCGEYERKEVRDERMD